MGPIALTFAAFTTVTIWLSWRRPDARLAGCILAVLSAISLVANRIGLSEDTRLTLNLTCDFIAAVGFVLAWRIIWPPRNWLFALAVTFLAQVMAHYTYTPGPGAAYRLQVVLNVLYVLQLLTVVVGPRAGEWIKDARAALTDAPRARRRGVRGGGGIVARADGVLQRIGSAALREKSR